MPVISRVARSHALPGTLKDIEIVASRLGDNAAMVGGAVLASRQAGPRVS